MYRSAECKVIILVSEWGCGPLEPAQIWMWDYKTSLHRWDELKVCSFSVTTANILASARGVVCFYSCSEILAFCEREGVMMVVKSQNISAILVALCDRQMEKDIHEHDWKFHWRAFHQRGRWWRAAEKEIPATKVWSFKVTVATHCTACAQNRRWNGVWKKKQKTQVQGRSQRTLHPHPPHPASPPPLRAAASSVLPSINHPRSMSE